MRRLHLGRVATSTITRASFPLACARRSYGVLYRTTPAVAKSAPPPLHQASAPSAESDKRDDDQNKPEAEATTEKNGKPNKKAHLKMGDTFQESSGVIVTTRGKIERHRIVREVGIVVGSSVKSRHVMHDLWARVLGFFGRSVVSYAEMMVDSSAEATFNLMHEASKRGANAVLRVRYETAASSDPAVWSSTFSYTLAYGTAVVVKPLPRKKSVQTSKRMERKEEEESDDEDN